MTYSLDVETDGEGLNGYSQLSSDEPTPETQLLVSETQKKIQKAISELPEKYKSVVLLYYFHDFSLQEIAGILNMPVTTIKTRLHRAREYLRKKIGREDETN
jgi:RNA polymerase sigma-70 factor (ECF subfamily)